MRSPLKKLPERFSRWLLNKTHRGGVCIPQFHRQAYRVAGQPAQVRVTLPHHGLLEGVP
jgi:hypothetical protein